MFVLVVTKSDFGCVLTKHTLAALTCDANQKAHLKTLRMLTLKWQRLWVVQFRKGAKTQTWDKGLTSTWIRKRDTLNSESVTIESVNPTWPRAGSFYKLRVSVCLFGLTKPEKKHSLVSMFFWMNNLIILLIQNEKHFYSQVNSVCIH